MCHLAVPFKRTIAATQKWNLWWLIEIVQAVQKRKCQREMSLTVLCSSVYIRYKKAYYLLPKTTYDILKHLDKLLWTLILNMLWNGKLWEVGSWFNSKQTICAAKNSLIFLCIILILTSDNTADNNTKVFPKKIQVNPPKKSMISPFKIIKV